MKKVCIPLYLMFLIKNINNGCFIKNLIFIPTVNKQYYCPQSSISPIPINVLKKQNDRIGKQQLEINTYKKEVFIL